jgi:hypothetical protein
MKARPLHDGWQRFLDDARLPLAGAVLIGFLFRWNKGEDNVLGVTKVLERMAYYQGRMSWRSQILRTPPSSAAAL